MEVFSLKLFPSLNLKYRTMLIRYKHPVIASDFLIPEEKEMVSPLIRRDKILFNFTFPTDSFGTIKKIYIYYNNTYLYVYYATPYFNC